MSRPIIGISAGIRNHYTPDREIQKVSVGCDIDYVESVLRSGGAPVILPRIASKDAIYTLIEAVDGLILSGGGDVVSLLYGEEPHPKSKYQDPVRDDMEFEAIRLADAANKPILGICRGIQTLNVAFGGTLIQDVPSRVPNACLHNTHAITSLLVHNVDIEPDSLLARVLGTTQTPVNSWHHQAVQDLGKGLCVNCRARDGVIEGIESSEGRPILAVQCHPEESTRHFPLFQKLFDWLVEEARVPRTVMV